MRFFTKRSQQVIENMSKPKSERVIFGRTQRRGIVKIEAVHFRGFDDRDIILPGAISSLQPDFSGAARLAATSLTRSRYSGVLEIPFCNA